MTSIKIRGTEHQTPHDAVTELNFSGDHAISIAGRFFTVRDGEYRRLQGEGIQPATWHHHEPTGRIISVPGNC